MLDWPVAAVLLGVLGTVVVAIIKLVPQRMVVENSRGEKCASSEDVQKVAQAIHDHQKYSEQRNHDILNAFSTVQSNILNAVMPTQNSISHDLVILVERSRNNRASHDQDD